MFKPNIGQTDRIVRIIAGVVLIALGVLTPGAMWVAVVGLIPLFSGLIGFCALAGMMKCCCKKSCGTSNADGTEKKSCGCGSGGCCSETPPAPPAA